jgi:hypothetical protein
MKKVNLTSIAKVYNLLAVVILALGLNSQLSAQCALTCNNLGQLSMDQDCSVELTPDMILEGTAPTACGALQVQAKINGAWTPAAGNYVVTNGQVNQTLEVRVRQTTAPFNSCWGYLHVEDKLAPVITCKDVTVSCALTATYLTPQGIKFVYGAGVGAYPANSAGTEWNGPGVVSNTATTFTASGIDNCSSVSLSYSDLVEDLPCSTAMPSYSAKITRTWSAVDAGGMVGTCSQTIWLKRATIAEVTFPADVTISCSNPPANPATAEGAPYVWDVFLPIYGPSQTGTGYCEMNVTRHDDTIRVCPGTFKILRTWTLYDWCQPTSATNPTYHLQVIKYIDDAAPVVVTAGFCGSTFTAGTNQNDCESDYNLPDFVAKDVCTAGLATAKATWSVNSVTYSLNGVITPTANAWSDERNVTFGIANNLPLGVTTVTYTLTDNCGNASTCTVKIDVVDDVPPVTICTEVTQVSLGSGDGVTCGSGFIDVPAASFDQGSYDNCGPVYFKVRRMDGAPCAGGGTANRFQNTVRFCCADAGQNRTVILRVYDVDPGTSALGLNDLDGHYNDCMIQVLVEDKIKPTCTPPAHVTVSCESFDPTYWAYGVATSYDNCCCVDEDATAAGVNPAPLAADLSGWDATCNRGTIIRKWRATDCHGNSGNICTQRIVVTYNQNYSIKWPNDVDVTACDGAATFGEPSITGKDCELTAVSYEDQVFTIVNDACRKIERTWTVINWCSYDANLACTQVNNPSSSNTGPTTVVPNANTTCYKYKQIIKINDNVAPVADEPVAVECDYSTNDAQLWNDHSLWDAAHSSHDLCEGGDEISITANDDCSKLDITIRALLFMDLNNDGVMETVWNSNDVNPAGRGKIWVNNANNPNYAGTTSLTFDSRATNKYGFALQFTTEGNKRKAWFRFGNDVGFSAPQLPYGNYKIKWFISDGCGNETSKEKVFVIMDCKKPTVVCRNGLSVNLMNNPAMQGVTLWASDFLQYGEDNCTPADQLVYAIIRSDDPAANGSFPLVNGQPRTSVVFNCGDGTESVQLWAKDKKGNADFCEAFIVVQDNMNVCPTPGGARVAGAAMVDFAVPTSGVEEVQFTLGGAAVPINTTLSTVNGAYNFNAIPVTSNVTVTPLKDNDPLNGVTTYDLLLISKHILGVDPLNTPYKMIAADANKSGSITTFDIVELRKLILGITTELPNNTSWRFVNKSQVLNSTNPFAEPIQEIYQVSNLASNVNNADFQAVKVGDVNNNAVANNLVSADDRTNGTLYFDVEDRNVKAGEEVTVNFNSSENMAGFQFTMNMSGLEVAEIVGGGNVKADNFAVFAADNALTASVDGDVKGFAVKFRATQDGQLSKMLGVGSRITKAEAYSKGGELNEVALRFNGANGTIVSGAGFELLQNTPNPVSATTNISFVLPEAAKATLRFSTADGRVIKTISNDFAKGINTVTINRSELKAGILFYQIDTPTNSAVKKMIVVD